MDTWRSLLLALVLITSLFAISGAEKRVKKRSVTVGLSLSYGRLRATFFVQQNAVSREDLLDLQQDIRAVGGQISKVQFQLEELSLKLKQYTSAERVIEVEMDLRSWLNTYQDILRAVEKLHNSSVTETEFNETALDIGEKLDGLRTTVQTEIPRLMFKLNSYIVGSSAAGAGLTNGFYCDAAEVAIQQARTDDNSTYSLTGPFQDGPLRQRDGLVRLQQFLISLHSTLCNTTLCQVQNEGMQGYIPGQDVVFRSCVPVWLETLITSGSVTGLLTWKSEGLVITEQSVNDAQRDDSGSIPAAGARTNSIQQKVTLEKSGAFYTMRVDDSIVTIHDNMKFALKRDATSRIALFMVTVDIQGSVRLVNTRFGKPVVVEHDDCLGKILVLGSGAQFNWTFTHTTPTGNSAPEIKQCKLPYQASASAASPSVLALALAVYVAISV